MKDIDILNERELEHLYSSSGDDVDMASVQCVVRELRHLRSQALTADDREVLRSVRAEIAEFGMADDDVHAHGYRPARSRALAALDKLLGHTEGK